MAGTEVSVKLTDQALWVLDRLRKGPASTVELQKTLPLVHVAKEIYLLRMAGYAITTKRLPNRIALYRLADDEP